MKKIIIILLLAVSSVILQINVWEKAESKAIRKIDLEDEEYRAKFYSPELLEEQEKLNFECRKYLKAVENDTSYYPVAESSVDKTITTSFINTWMSERTYGGKRGHEGIDIMALTNKRGLYPVISMSDGVITNLGWLEKGGYRIGISSKSGIYYYYAHLDSYSSIQKGDYIKAGDLLGYMGDTGYGKEGTKGKFAVHLHIGIYIYEKGKEISVNPYYVLKSLENKKLKYAYS